MSKTLFFHPFFHGLFMNEAMHDERPLQQIGLIKKKKKKKL